MTSSEIPNVQFGTYHSDMNRVEHQQFIQASVESNSMFCNHYHLHNFITSMYWLVLFTRKLKLPLKDASLSSSPSDKELLTRQRNPWMSLMSRFFIEDKLTKSFLHNFYLLKIIFNETGWFSFVVRGWCPNNFNFLPHSVKISLSSTLYLFTAIRSSSAAAHLAEVLISSSFIS